VAWSDQRVKRPGIRRKLTVLHDPRKQIPETLMVSALAPIRYSSLHRISGFDIRILPGKPRIAQNRSETRPLCELGGLCVKIRC
jgi:hypothetical protein